VPTAGKETGSTVPQPHGDCDRVGEARRGGRVVSGAVSLIRRSQVHITLSRRETLSKLFTLEMNAVSPYTHVRDRRFSQLYFAAGMSLVRRPVKLQESPQIIEIGDFVLRTFRAIRIQ